MSVGLALGSPIGFTQKDRVRILPSKPRHYPQRILIKCQSATQESQWEDSQEAKNGDYLCNPFIYKDGKIKKIQTQYPNDVSHNYLCRGWRDGNNTEILNNISAVVNDIYLHLMKEITIDQTHETKKKELIDKLYQTNWYQDIIDKYSRSIRKEIADVEGSKQREINNAISSIKEEMTIEHRKLKRYLGHAENLNEKEVKEIRIQISEMNWRMAKYFNEVLSRIDDTNTIGKMVAGEGVTPKDFFIAIAKCATGGILGNEAAELAKSIVAFIRELD